MPKVSVQPPATVFVVDDDAPVRKSLTLILETAGHQVEAFSTAQDFLSAFDTARPGCLLSDVRMPGMDGMALLRRLTEMKCKLPVIMLTAHGDVPMAVDAMKIGAVEFLEKPAEPSALRSAVAAAIQFDAAQRAALAEAEEIATLLRTLTDREREVHDLLIAGKPARTIATVLGTAHNTIRIHRGRLMKKMRADNVADLIRMANLLKEDE